MTQFILLYPMTTIIFYSLFCLAIGSLLNVIIYRLPIMLQAEWAHHCRSFLHLPQEQHVDLNLFYPRSFCPNCKIVIPFWHNIPLLSYLLLRGRCSKCHQNIPLRYPAIEGTFLILSLIAVWVFGFNPSLILALFFICLIICLAVIDFQHQLLPDSLTITLLWAGLIANTQTLFTSLTDAVLSAAGAYIFLWLFIKLFYLIRGKIGMGNGDFKLFAAFGAWFGWTQLPLILLIASLSGAMTGLIYLKVTKQNHDTPIPFGPFLCFAGLVSLFYGPAMIHWYIHVLS